MTEQGTTPHFEPLQGAASCEAMHPDSEGWSDWIHPFPGYVMQCCGCSLAHDMEFAITQACEDNDPATLNDGEDAERVIVFRAKRHGDYGGELAYWNGVAMDLGFTSICEAMEELTSIQDRRRAGLTKMVQLDEEIDRN